MAPQAAPRVHRISSDLPSYELWSGARRSESLHESQQTRPQHSERLSTLHNPLTSG